VLIAVVYPHRVEQVHLHQNVLTVLGQNVAAGQFLILKGNSKKCIIDQDLRCWRSAEMNRAVEVWARKGFAKRRKEVNRFIMT